MKFARFFALSFLAFASLLSSLGWTGTLQAADCPLSGPISTLPSLPGYKALSTIDPVKVLDQLTISESNLIWTAVQGSLDSENPQLDAAQAWAVFADVPRFYNGGRIEYFGLDRERFALVSYFPNGQQQGFVAKLQTNSSSLRDLRKARFEVLADLRAGSFSCR